MSCDPVDFTPSVCSATAIQGCIFTRDCELHDLAVPGVEFDASSALEGIGTFRIALNGFDACFLVALAQAFVNAGCEMPALPSTPTVPDLSECIAELSALKDEAQDPLGIIGSVLNVDLDDEFLPTRIRVGAGLG
jgi:hypothetical protein